MSDYNPSDADPLPEGIYDATIEKAEKVTAKSSGKPIIKLTLKIHSSGRETTVFDNISLAAALWRLKQVASAIGKLEAFKTGNFLASDYEKKHLKVDLVVEASEEFGSKNRVQEYMAGGAINREATVTTPPVNQPKAPLSHPTSVPVGTPGVISSPTVQKTPQEVPPTGVEADPPF